MNGVPEQAEQDSVAEAFVNASKSISPCVLALGSGNAETLTINELEVVVIADPEFSLRVLALANSAFYSQQREITALRSALVVLGTDTVRNLAVSVLARSVHTTSRQTDENLWLHCQAVGVAGQMLAEVHHKVPPRQAFAAGLLHDIGILAQQQYDGAKSENLHSHAVYGAEIANLLGLSASLSRAIGNHDEFENIRFENEPLIATVWIANHIADRCGFGYDEDSVGESHEIATIVSSLDLRDADIDTLADCLPKQIEELQCMLGRSAGATR